MVKPWANAAQSVYNDTTAALQTVFDSLNKGQQQKLLKDEKVKSLFERYGVVTDGSA